MKNRAQKQLDYENKFGMIPVDFESRLGYMYDLFNVSDSMAAEIINLRNDMISSLYYNDLDIILYQVPEGTPRPRFRIVNKANYANCAATSPFVHVYNLHAKEDSVYMHRIVGQELSHLPQLICTPVISTFNCFLETPKSLPVKMKFMCELGIKRPITKPDYDNLAKKYSDMSNHNIWLDDAFTISGTVNMFYSILPRIEINIKFLNMLYSASDYRAVSNRKDFIEYGCSTTYFGG